jgi:hypothetical protein
MRNVARIGTLIGALAVATLPARADDQVGLATGQRGVSALALADYQQARTGSSQRGAAQRAAPLPQVSSEAYAGFAKGGAYMQTCSHSGGPKNSNWTCR